MRYTADLASDGEVIRGYLNGGTFSYEGEKGWYLIMADGFSSGWGKLAGGIMKTTIRKDFEKCGSVKMRFLSGQNAIVQGGTLIVLLMDQKSMKWHYGEKY